KDGAFLTTEWLTTSTDGGQTWSTSRRVTPTFDQAAAAQAGGYFLGDYQALDGAGTSFQPFFVANLAIQASGALGSDTFSTRIRSGVPAGRRISAPPPLASLAEWIGARLRDSDSGRVSCRLSRWWGCSRYRSPRAARAGRSFGC